MSNNTTNTHGFQEISIQLWNPEEKDRRRNLSIGIHMDEEKLTEIHNQLYTNLKNYHVKNDNYQVGVEQLIKQTIKPLMRNGLIKYVECDDYNVHNIKDLQKRLKDDDCEICNNYM